MLCELARRCRSAATDSADLDDDDPADTTVGAADLWTGSLLPQPADARVDATEQVEYRVVWLWGSGGALCRVGCDGVEGGRVGRRHHLFEQTLLRVDPPGSTHPLRTFVILSTLYQVGHGTGSVLYLALAVLKYYKKVTLGGRHFCRQVTMGQVSKASLASPNCSPPFSPFPFFADATAQPLRARGCFWGVETTRRFVSAGSSSCLWCAEATRRFVSTGKPWPHRIRCRLPSWAVCRSHPQSIVSRPESA